MIRSVVMDASWVRSVALLEEQISLSPWSVEMLLEELRLGAWLQGLVVGERSLVGYAVARPLFDEWHLLTLGVAPESRRQGLGRRLVEALLAEVVRQQGRCVVLEVRISNEPARLLYQGLGFVTVGRRRGYYRFGPDGPEDALVMTAVPGRTGCSEGMDKFFLA
ncbi:MAG: ribosomal protein S18-alanine N-acetyltransferase [Magnetococcales bacterium]|nr:ribosomal protein S18-alanine N-acetyltransferase [Magnetococcales bacterium]NGZ06230.1 ribosomal protein S18-alanine N-acetyltransferase [Magnetococcales bacterium]